MGRPVLFMFLIAASLTDLRARYIDNLQNVFFFVLGLVFAFLERGIEGAVDGILSALLVFALLYVFYAGGYLGAGDIKFIMSIAVYTGHEVLKESLIPVTAFSVLLLLFMAVRTGKIKGIRIPMALPVSLGILMSI
ncbi:MAG: A24 family peptidase [Lachnospiraceae bacterium]|nr:A24 family peptidase [Lachnospiraceae bacterium]